MFSASQPSVARIDNPGWLQSVNARPLDDQHGGEFLTSRWSRELAVDMGAADVVEGDVVVIDVRLAFFAEVDLFQVWAWRD